MDRTRHYGHTLPDSVRSTKQGDAPVNYQGEQSNEAFNVYCPELDMFIYSEYTPGNVSPRRDPLGLLERGLEKLPPGVESVSLRMDSAGYNMDLLRYCCEGRSPWGVIHFGISVSMYLPYREAVQKFPEDAWQRLDDTTEWAEVNRGSQEAMSPRGISKPTRPGGIWRCFRSTCSAS